MFCSRKTMLVYEFICTVLILSINSVISAPAEVVAAGSSEITIPRLIGFENGKVGVNFLGFKASAGLGGLLTGNAADGGLHAEAQTPFGQAAKAGLAGTVGEQGKAIGGLYADATPGGGINAEAGLAGYAGPEGIIRKAYAGTITGSSVHESTLTNPAIALRNNFEASNVGDTVIQKTKIVEDSNSRSYIEKPTSTSNQEKPMDVSSYIEKTVIKQKPIVPTLQLGITKEVNVPTSNINYNTSIRKEVAPEILYRKTKIRTHPHFRKQVWLGAANGYNDVHTGSDDAGYRRDYNSAVNVRKTVNPQLFNDIFNIPISTLQAVNRLVGGIVGGTSGSVAVSKSVNTYY